MFTVVVEPVPVPPDARLRVSGFMTSPLPSPTVLAPVPPPKLKVAPPTKLKVPKIRTVLLTLVPMLISEEEEAPILTVVVVPEPVPPEPMLIVSGFELSLFAKDAVVRRGFEPRARVALPAVPAPVRMLTVLFAAEAPDAIATVCDAAFADVAILTAVEVPVPMLTVAAADRAPEARFTVRVDSPVPDARLRV